MKENTSTEEKKDAKWFLKTLQKRVTDGEVTTYSIVVAYYLLLSLFPLLIAVGNILPLLQIDPGSVLPYIQEIIPNTVYSFLKPAIESLLTEGSGGLLSISTITTIWSASQSMNGLQKATNNVYGVEGYGIFSRFHSMLMLIVLLLGMVLVTLVMGSGKVILDYLQDIFHFSDTIISTFQTAKWPTTILVMLVVMILIYWIIPNVKVSIRSTIPGAVFTTIGWMLLSQVFGLYARYFASRVSGYQIIGSFIVLMLWLNFAALILILGSVINAVCEEYFNGEITEKSQSIDKRTTRLKNKVMSALKKDK